MNSLYRESTFAAGPGFTGVSDKLAFGRSHLAGWTGSWLHGHFDGGDHQTASLQSSDPLHHSFNFQDGGTFPCANITNINLKAIP